MQFTAEMIAGLISGEVVGDKNATVHTVSSIEDGKEGGLAYLSNPKYEQYLYTTRCSIVLVDKAFEPKSEVAATLIKVENVGACVLQLLQMYQAMKPQKSGISPRASISEKATIGQNCYIGDFAVIEAGAVVGNGAKIYPQCYVGDNVWDQQTAGPKPARRIWTCGLIMLTDLRLVSSGSSASAPSSARSETRPS